ncbi:hypothetical protein [Kineosporia sp. R_H_3]|uniref:hypothetical protein n=1 Tax=Kineosporia sp. R_H_3 TaxID=1961848 RepID=UPI000B4A8DE4|nr:hypothetical protein [Kineosporia sp. R_H_3]
MPAEIPPQYDPSARPDTPLLDRATELHLTLAAIGAYFDATPQLVAAWLTCSAPIPPGHRHDLAQLLKVDRLEDLDPRA